MTWREQLLHTLGAGLFAGATAGDWLAVLGQNAFAVDPPYLLRAVVNTFCSLLGSALARCETWAYGPQVRGVTVPPPLFVLGHWRSGTTLLHNLLAADPRFAAPTLFQVNFPLTFLLTERTVTRLTGFFVPRTRLGLDNVTMDFGMAYEDEFATCAATGLSPYAAWAFPRRADRYDRYLTFRNVRAAEVERWGRALAEFLRKLTWKYNRPLVLKSPPHTARVEVLLRLFPDARFVHLRRDPYTVFQSTVRMNEVGWRYYALQRPPSRAQIEERVLRQYREMYEAFFAQRSLIPAGHFHEIAFEELERGPIGRLREMYEALGLPDFGEAELAIRKYVDSLAGYRKNQFPDLPTGLRKRVACEWARCFTEWGYPV